MVQKSPIEWCTHTSNPIKFRDRATGKSVWGCIRRSPGCAHCYSADLAKRYGRGGDFTAEELAGYECYIDDEELKSLLSVRRIPAGSKCFVGDMTDVFGEWVPFEFLDRLFAVFALRPDVVFQLLTKRPERMREWASNPATPAHIAFAHARIERPGIREGLGFTANLITSKVEFPWWPLPNVWLGTSVELQRWADVRIPELLATPAAVRFLSCEPLLSELHLEEYLNGSYEVSGGRGIPRGGDGRTDHRRGGSHLAGGSPSGQQMVGRDDDDPVRSPSGRESDRLGLSPSTRDDRLLAGTRAGASAGMAALPRADSSGADHQSQEREPIGQQARQFGTGDYLGAGPSQDPRAGLEARTQLSWVIVGGESGPGARPFDLAWARSLVSQCRAAGVAVFYKQGGKSNRCPHSAKGGCFECIPDDLQIREMPL